VELQQNEKFGDIEIVWLSDSESAMAGSMTIDDYEG